MSLEEYRKLRDLMRSPEPAGEEKKRTGTIFVVQEHNAHIFIMTSGWKWKVS